jgi:Carboxypeptidase regulatory-like domain
MRIIGSLRRGFVAGLVMAAFLVQETWALAGVTGNLAGNVRDNTGAPVAGATIQVVSPSQQASTTTDAGGHFAFLSLAPDTYTVNISKAGYQATSFPGNVVFADQTQQSTFTINKTLKVIANVTATGAGALVKSGVGSDLYSVNSAQAAAAAPFGGGGQLNSAYSTMATVPGLQVNLGGLGWTYSATYVRGQNQQYTGFEYDGIPVNRAFDNYNSSTESSLGLQELQVYTGGGPSSVASAGTAGFINQVIKTGTYPGYATADLGVGTPSFYHQAQVEIGGATPDRNFSWYAGFSGYDQAFRFGTQDNAASYMLPNGYYSGPSAIGFGIGYTASPTVTGQGVKSSCPVGAAPPPTSVLPQGCWEYYSGLGESPSFVTDREDVINLHFGIPKHNGLRDDIQAMWSTSALNNLSYSSPADIASSADQFYWALFHAPYAAPTCGASIPYAAWAGASVTGCTVSKFGAYLPYADQVVYNLPFGTPVASSPTKFVAPSIYYAPDTPGHEFDGPIPNDDPSINPYQNDTGITKLQYTYALSTAAYLRVYGYTLYSDWLQNSPIFGATDESTPSVPDAQYLLMAHTSGGALNFNDQVNDQNLVGADYNFTTAGVIRWNNSSALAGVGTTPIGYMGASGKCYDAHNGATVPCLASEYYDTALKAFVNPGGVYTGGTGSCDTSSNPVPCGWMSNAIAGPTGFPTPGATWDTLWQGNATGSYNTVRPRFQNASISDQWRPNDKFLVNASLRYDNFTYVLPDSDNAATQFYANMTTNYTCVQPSTNQVLQEPLPPGAPPPAPAIYVVGDCNTAAAKLFPSGPHTGWVHPNGITQDGVAAPNFTSASPGSYNLNYWEPRFSATYTESPDTVWRVSAGRYTQPPISASVQYLSASGDDRSVWNNTMGLGFYSPFHPIPGISSAQYDLSYERHLTGTDMSLKVTPFFTWVNGYQQDTFIGSNFATQVPIGVNRDYGMEFQFTKGDFNRNGLSGLFSFTYTNSKVRYENYGLSTGGFVPNQTTALNGVINQYNALTKAGGGSQCYRAGSPVACTAPPVTINGTTFDAILNPYYDQPEQSPLDPNGWYNPYEEALSPALNPDANSLISPAIASLVVNYRTNKLAITPSVQFQAGGWYGSPLDVAGYDPRVCAQNSGHTGITDTNPLQCNVDTVYAAGAGPYGYLFIPNPQTGHFSGIGSYEQPNIMTGNLQLTYDVSPKVKLTVTGAGLFRYCFAGTPEPWTAVYGPSPSVCGYSGAGSPLNSSLYPSNFYNGKGITDAKKNGGVVTPWTQSYTPGTNNLGAIGGNWLPYGVYFTAQIKI